MRQPPGFDVVYLEPGKTKSDAKAVGTDRYHSTYMNALHQ